MKNIQEFTITRVFNAPLDLVWKMHTEEKHLEKWWGPKGFKMISCKVDLRPGGIFHYGMQSPEGLIIWGKFVYKEISPKTKLVFVDSFSDEKGGYTRHPLAEGWPVEILNTVTLSEENRKTTLTLKAYPINSSEEENNMFNSAFDSMTKGFGGTYDQLKEYLSTTQ